MRIFIQFKENLVELWTIYQENNRPSMVYLTVAEMEEIKLEPTYMYKDRNIYHKPHILQGKPILSNASGVLNLFRLHLVARTILLFRIPNLSHSVYYR